MADLVGSVPVQRWVYYCVDDLSEWPGLDRTALEEMERVLVSRVDEVVVASDSLAERMASLGRESTVLTHGVDLEHWNSPSDEGLPVLEGLPRPLIVFWGVVDQRLDDSWLECLSDRLEAGSILLVGPANNPDPRLGSLRGVHLPGPIAYRHLPNLAREASVLIMPYADLPATRAMQPLKLKEYLATDLPVVVSRLPATAEWRDACDVVASAESFVQTVLSRLETGVPSSQRTARLRLEADTWERKSERFAEFVLGTAGVTGRPR